jgi:hypothetical protein
MLSATWLGALQDKNWLNPAPTKLWLSKHRYVTSHVCYSMQLLGTTLWHFTQHLPDRSMHYIWSEVTSRKSRLNFHPLLRSSDVLTRIHAYAHTHADTHSLTAVYSPAELYRRALGTLVKRLLQNRNWRMASCGMLRHVALVRTDVSEELSASISRVKRIGELGTTLAVTSNRSTLILRLLFLVNRFLSPWWWRS